LAGVAADLLHNNRVGDQGAPHVADYGYWNSTGRQSHENAPLGDNPCKTSAHATRLLVSDPTTIPGVSVNAMVEYTFSQKKRSNNAPSVLFRRDVSDASHKALIAERPSPSQIAIRSTSSSVMASLVRS
jgi:hypothetical protein